MEESKKKVYKYAKSISNICHAARICIVVTICISVGLMLDALIQPQHAEKIYTLFDDSITTGIDEDMELDIKFMAMIAAFNAILTLVLTFFFVRIVRSIAQMIMSGSTPFTAEIAKRMRRMAYFTLLFLLVNPVLTVGGFLLCMLMSALFEYGAYLQAKADQTSRIQEEMIVSFAEITENKSAQTGNHVKRVSEYSKLIAAQMGLPEEECERIRLASTMHDIGKLLIAANILEKPARLTDEEFLEIKKHSGYGGMLLESVEGDIMELARVIALEHHERPDGRGYPDGKKGDEISLEGRIVAVADVYDALTSKRSYKDAWDPKLAYDEIVKNSGSQFDEKVVEAFKSAYGEIEKTRASYSDTAKLTFKHANA